MRSRLLRAALVLCAVAAHVLPAHTQSAARATVKDTLAEEKAAELRARITPVRFGPGGGH